MGSQAPNAPVKVTIEKYEGDALNAALQAVQFPCLMKYVIDGNMKGTNKLTRIIKTEHRPEVFTAVPDDDVFGF